MTTETRQGKVLGVREVDGVHQADLQIVTYDVVDSYKTSWAPGVFARSIAEGAIPAVWSHREDEPIGVVTNFRDSGDCLVGTLEFLDFASVPKAKMAYESLRKGAIKGVSFRFERETQEPDKNNRGVERITSAAMIEISPVLRPAVPGSKVLAVRSGETVSKTIASELLVKFSTGQIDLADALMELKTNAGTGEGAPPSDPAKIETQLGTEENTPEPVVVPQPEPDEEELDMLDKLEALSRGDAPKPYGDVKYADSKNGKYPIDTKEHAKAAWAYINMPKNADKYPLNGVSLSSVKDKIKAACKKFGVETN